MVDVSDPPMPQEIFNTTAIKALEVAFNKYKVNVDLHTHSLSKAVRYI